MFLRRNNLLYYRIKPKGKDNEKGNQSYYGAKTAYAGLIKKGCVQFVVQ